MTKQREYIDGNTAQNPNYLISFYDWKMRVGDASSHSATLHIHAGAAEFHAAMKPEHLRELARQAMQAAVEIEEIMAENAAKETKHA